MLHTQVLTDVRLQPWLRRRTAAALVNEGSVAHAACGGYPFAGPLKLADIRRALRHAYRNAVRRKDNLLCVRKLDHSISHAPCHDLNKLRTVMEVRQLLDDHVLHARRLESVYDVLPILPAA